MRIDAETRNLISVLASIMEREPKQLVYSLNELTCSLARMRRAVMEGFEVQHEHGGLTTESRRAFLTAYEFLGKFFDERSVKLCERLVRDENTLTERERELLSRIRAVVFYRCQDFCWEFMDFRNEVFGSLSPESPSFDGYQFDLKFDGELADAYAKFVDCRGHS